MKETEKTLYQIFGFVVLSIKHYYLKQEHLYC